jgi:curli biogenesis system outer membrane secretion channel CsgG
MKKSFFGFCFFVILGCVSSPKISEEMEMIKPILDSEYEKIIQSMPADSPITVWWCFDERFETGTVSVVSDWVQRSFEEMLVDSKKFRVVTRIHLQKIFEEQRFQLTGHVDEKTLVSIARILGAKYMVVSTITRYNTLDVQILNSETAEIVYVSNKPIQKPVKEK